MEKRINLKHSVFQITQAYPEVIDILSSLGFTEIRKKAVRLSVGKMVTIPRGAAVKGIDMEHIVRALEAGGFTLEGVPEGIGTAAAAKPAGTAERIKTYLKRLDEGEPLETVRADFAREFGQADATEIMKAEQELIGGGRPVKEVKALCDVHSALFHAGGTAPSQHPEPDAQGVPAAATSGAGMEKARALRNTKGHPLQTLYRENEAILRALDKLDESLRTDTAVTDALRPLRAIGIHYAKKGDLIYPVLNVQYGISGPSQVMWTIDDEIRSEISALTKAATRDPQPDKAWRERVEAVAKRAREMTFKEDNILFPVCAANFTVRDWLRLYADSKVYGRCLDAAPETWDDGEAYLAALKNPETQAPDADLSGSGTTTGGAASGTSGTLTLAGGTLSLGQLSALLDTLPMEITFVDADNLNRYFNRPFAEKVFKRPLSALGREVFTCHPPKVEAMVRTIIDDFRTGRRDHLTVWMEKGGRTMRVTYMAVRDGDGRYLGTMELVEDMEEAKAHLTKGK